jgi:glycosyltransferase involved in cell wall biosynthesis
MNTVGAVVCTLNSELSIRLCLESLQEARVEQIIVVDGGSSDGTRRIVEEFGVQLVEDPGLGLGLARNIGVRELSTDLALIFGSDNSISGKTLESMTRKISEGFTGVSCRTMVNDSGFLARCLNYMWAAKIQPGVKNTIGTPQLFSTSTLQQVQFSLGSSFSDDTDLCERLGARMNATFYTVPEFCLENGKASWGQLRLRYRYYGLSDWEIYEKNSHAWSLSRKIRSLLHPLRTELVTYLKYQPLYVTLWNFPVVFYVTCLRYKNWFQKSMQRH